MDERRNSAAKGGSSTGRFVPNAAWETAHGGRRQVSGADGGGGWQDGLGGAAQPPPPQRQTYASPSASPPLAPAATRTGGGLPYSRSPPLPPHPFSSHPSPYAALSTTSSTPAVSSSSSHHPPSHFPFPPLQSTSLSPPTPSTSTSTLPPRPPPPAPSVRPWTAEEDAFLLSHRASGRKFAEIAPLLPSPGKEQGECMRRWQELMQEQRVAGVEGAVNGTGRGTPSEFGPPLAANPSAPSPPPPSASASTARQPSKAKPPKLTDEKTAELIKLKKEGKTHAEIAERLGRSKGSVEKMWKQVQMGSKRRPPEAEEPPIIEPDLPAWTEREDDVLLTRRKAETSFTEIGGELGRSLFDVLSRWNKEFRGKQGGNSGATLAFPLTTAPLCAVSTGSVAVERVLSPGEIARVVELKKAGAGPAEITSRMGLSLKGSRHVVDALLKQLRLEGFDLSLTPEGVARKAEEAAAKTVKEVRQQQRLAKKQEREKAKEQVKLTKNGQVQKEKAAKKPRGDSTSAASPALIPTRPTTFPKHTFFPASPPPADLEVATSAAPSAPQQDNLPKHTFFRSSPPPAILDDPSSTSSFAVLAPAAALPSAAPSDPPLDQNEQAKKRARAEESGGEGSKKRFRSAGTAAMREELEELDEEAREWEQKSRSQDDDAEVLLQLEEKNASTKRPFADTTSTNPPPASRPPPPSFADSPSFLVSSSEPDFTRGPSSPRPAKREGTSPPPPPHPPPNAASIRPAPSPSTALVPSSFVSAPLTTTSISPAVPQVLQAFRFHPVQKAVRSAKRFLDLLEEGSSDGEEG